MIKTISQLGEFGLIDLISKNLLSTNNRIVVGMGDDTAVVESDKGKQILLTTDMLIEGVHFKKNEDLNLVARKSLNCNISDIASMGGIPQFALISFGCPKNLDIKRINQFLSGIKSILKKYNCFLVGGDIVKSRKIIINVALVGEVEKNKYILRSTAKNGDRIFVTGPLGGSLKSEHHLKFTPRLKESQYLVNNFKINSMIDVSDGLAADFGHILERSNVGADIYEIKIPVRKGFKLKNALSDGEDFELVFTMSESQSEKLKSQKNPFKFYEIGIVNDKKSGFNLIKENGSKEKLVANGFKHF